MYKIDDIVECVVTGFKEYGIFVKVDSLYDGLIHISEISDCFVRNVSDYAEIGEKIYSKVIEVDDITNHLKLSIKNINYKIDGQDVNNKDLNGFLPLKEILDIWVNEKMEEIKNSNS